VRAPFAPVLHPSLLETCAVSSLSFPTLPPSIRGQRLPSQLVRGDDKYTVWLGVWHIDDAQAPPSPCLPDGNPRTFPTKAVFPWATEDSFDFIFRDAMVVDMRLASGRIVVEANLHSPFPYYSGGRWNPNAGHQARREAEAKRKL
jgi:hypothetical protein